MMFDRGTSKGAQDGRLVSDRGVGERDGVGTIDDRVEVMYEMQVVEVFALTDARACILAAGEVTTTSVE